MSTRPFTVSRTPVRACAQRKCAAVAAANTRRATLATTASLIIVQQQSAAKAEDSQIDNRDAQAQPRVYMEIGVDGKPFGRVEIELFDSSTVATQRFRDLCKNISGVGYQRSKFDALFPDRYVRNFGVNALSYGEGSSPITGGDSISGLERELTSSKRRHDSGGLVSLQVKPAKEIVESTKLVAENGKLVEITERSGIVPNGTGFAITVGAVPELDATHLVVGRVVSGMDVVDAFSKLPKVKNNSKSPFFMAGKAAGDKRANVAELGFDRPFNKISVLKSGIV